MNILGLGLDFKGERLIAPIDEQDFSVQRLWGVYNKIEIQTLKNFY